MIVYNKILTINNIQNIHFKLVSHIMAIKKVTIISARLKCISQIIYTTNLKGQKNKISNFGNVQNLKFYFSAL